MKLNRRQALTGIGAVAVSPAAVMNAPARERDFVWVYSDTGVETVNVKATLIDKFWNNHYANGGTAESGMPMARSIFEDTSSIHDGSELTFMVPDSARANEIASAVEAEELRFEEQRKRFAEETQEPHA